MDGFFSIFYKKDKGARSEQNNATQKEILVDNQDIVIEHEQSFYKLTKSYIDQIKVGKETVCRLEEEIVLLKSSLEQASDANIQVRQELHEAKTQISSLKSFVDGGTKKGKAVSQELEMIKLLLTEKSKEYNILNDEKFFFKRQVDSVTAEKTKTIQECERLRSELNGLRKENHKLYEELQHKNKTYNQMHNDFEKASIELHYSKHSLTKTNDDKDMLEQQIKKLTEENKTLLIENDMLANIIKRDCIANKKRDLELENLRNKIEQKKLKE